MTDFDHSLLMKDAAELADMLSAGTLTSEQLAQQTLSAINTLNSSINCYISVDKESALAAARASDLRRQQGKVLSPLDGLTLAVKDNIDVAGMVTTAGLNIPPGHAAAAQDAFVVGKLRDAGCVILGKLNLNELALGADNRNPHHGNCANPHRLTHTPGGSSGGSGAAVAAGLCAFALGSDTMGSVRIPASYCGVTGIKATAGAISIGGSVVVSRRLDNIAPLVRSPRDLALVLPGMVGYDINCAQSRPVTFHNQKTDISSARIAVAGELHSAGVEKEIVSRFQEAVALFAEAGAETVEKPLDDFDFGASRRAGLFVCELDMYIYHQQQLADNPEFYSPDVKAMMDWGRGKTSVDVVEADWRIDKSANYLSHLLNGVDFLLLPTAPQTAFDFNDPTPAGQADLTHLANMSGHPAISVPMGCSQQGLPMGLQIIGHYGSDRQLIALAEWFYGLDKFPLPKPALKNL